MKKIALIMAGCGHQDGSEVTEVVSCLIALSALGASLTTFAPDDDFEAFNFETRQPLGQKRSYRLEAMRITRRSVQPLSQCRPEDFDALVVPGGSGFGRRFSTWFEQREKMVVDEFLASLIRGFYDQSKPICAICISPLLVGWVLRDQGVTITAGLNDYTFLQTAWGIQVEPCPSTDFVTDRFHRLVTTPAFMNSNAGFHEVFTGIRLAIQETWEMA